MDPMAAQAIVALEEQNAKLLRHNRGLEIAIQEAHRDTDAALLQVSEYRKMLWWCARNAGLALHIPKAELESIPEGAELLCWYEKLFDSMILKGICSPINQPDLAKPVIEKPNPEIDICGVWVIGVGMCVAHVPCKVHGGTIKSPK